MKLLILAGGSGSAALQLGLKALGSNHSVSVMINAWDDGKSTGLCRKVMGTLGPSDIRKNHLVQYLAAKRGCSDAIPRFYNLRGSFRSIQGEAYCRTSLDTVALDSGRRALFEDYIREFFEVAKKVGVARFDDFSIINILYSVGFKRNGVLKTIDEWRRHLDIEDRVVLCSTSEVTLRAKTRNGVLIESESDISDFGGHGDRIEKVMFSRPVEATGEALAAVDSADAIVLAPGTWFSSLLPTLSVPGIASAIVKSRAVKIMILNNRPDRDFSGWDIEEFCRRMLSHIHPEDFSFIENTNAPAGLRFPDGSRFSSRVMRSRFDVDGGRHRPEQLARAVLALLDR